MLGMSTLTGYYDDSTTNACYYDDSTTKSLGKLQDSAPQLWGLLHDGDSYAQNPFCYIVQQKPL